MATATTARRALAVLLAGAAAAVAQSGAKVGATAPSVRLFDAAGVADAAAPPPGAKALVLVWFHTACPVARASLPEVTALAKDFAASGVSVVLVNAHEEQVPAVVASAAARAPGIPVRFDRDAAAARAFGVVRVPTALVVDAARRLRYRGRIFERYTGRDEGTPQIGRLDLRRAVEDVLAGREVAVPETPAAGCVVPPSRTAAASRPTTPLTFAADVAPILARRCGACHGGDGPGPMPLRTYDEVRPYVHDVAEVVWDGMMPPWREDGHGVRLRGERRLTDVEKGTIVRWAQGGAPEGAPAASAPASEAPKEKSPDPGAVVLWSGATETPAFGAPYDATFEFAAEGPVRDGPPRAWAATRVDVRLPRPEGIRSVLVERVADGAWLAFRTPGDAPAADLPNAAWRFASGEKLRVVVRIRPHGVATREEFAVVAVPAPDGVTAPEPITLRAGPEAVEPGAAPARPFIVPAGEAHATFTFERRLDVDGDVVALLPDLRHLGREAFVDLLTPEGAVRRLAGTSRWDPRLRAAWSPEVPVRASAGSRLRFVAIYDNSEANRRNPSSPPVDVRSGSGPRDEACGLRALVVPRGP